MISLTFNYFRELFRFFTALSAALLILEESELKFYNYFFSSLATVLGLSTNKRNYNVLKPDEQSSTIMTIADDYIHYNSPRALTVREMSRLQYFDDSFVFQGNNKGGLKHQNLTCSDLVVNSFPPLMARAIGLEILINL
ncbi:DNA cytosine methyltransferase [Subsaximicrobium wynnwilliamsii]|uniref:DNA cytosine methyltransferase n=2 Tax=Subsaximicrobium wynnwilliamsii TaxID=291179 RepID=A0A5C6ZFD3_9FLAO|nr:DNA cytosine methyltransferase [Subsaximicrobium wynnwilliamsii]TXD88712.1 DNA cytosine methyltransferase [Subsaximicrobium wynnwilliamsii]TXE02804.1 DNA cytosine methyltransferase [Subsaximicrobium wynnwilliamsii]